MKKIILATLGGVLWTAMSTNVAMAEESPNEEGFLQIRHSKHVRHHRHYRHHPRRHFRSWSYGPAMTYSQWCLLPGNYRYSYCRPYVPGKPVIILNSFNAAKTAGLYQQVSEENPYVDHYPGGTAYPPRTPAPVNRF